MKLKTSEQVKIFLDAFQYFLSFGRFSDTIRLSFCLDFLLKIFIVVEQLFVLRSYSRTDVLIEIEEFKFIIHISY